MRSLKLMCDYVYILWHTWRTGDDRDRAEPRNLKRLCVGHAPGHQIKKLKSNCFVSGCVWETQVASAFDTVAPGSTQPSETALILMAEEYRPCPERLCAGAGFLSWPVGSGGWVGQAGWPPSLSLAMGVCGHGGGSETTSTCSRALITAAKGC